MCVWTSDRIDLPEMLEIGTSLREARQRRRLGYAEIEAETQIPSRYLQALEHEEFDRLPAGLYRRSFLREYADYLDLDGAIYVAEYELRQEPQPDIVPGPQIRAEHRRRRLAHVRPAGTVAVLAGVLLLIAVAAWELANRGGQTAATVQKPAQTHRPAPPRRHAAPPAAPTTTTRTPPPALILSATDGDCWLSVQIASTGRAVYTNTLRQGQTARFGLRKPLLIRLGAPSNLTVRIGGRSVTANLPSGTSDVLAAATGLRPVS